MTELFLAIEGGGTNTRVLLVDVDENMLVLERGGPSSPLYVDAKSYSPMLEKMLGIVTDKIESIPGAKLQAIGLAGPMDHSLVNFTLEGMFPTTPIHHASEGEIALALYEISVGVSITAGTGSSCRAVNERGEWVSGGGLGPQFGDEGSAYWIGKTAISTLACPDGNTIFDTPLAREFRTCFKVRSFWDILHYKDKNGHLPVHQIALFTKHVVQAAKEGDPIALDVLAEAGRKLGRLVLDTVRRIHFQEYPIPLVPSGGVFHIGDMVLRPMKNTLRSGKIAFKHYPPVTEPCWGLTAWLLKQYGKKATRCQDHHSNSSG